MSDKQTTIFELAESFRRVVEELGKRTDELEAVARLHETALEAAPNAMLMVDAASTILLVNRQTEKLFGYSRDEMLGQSVNMLVPDSVRAAHPEMFASFFSDPQTRAMGAGRDLAARRKDGSEIPVEIGLNPIQTDTGVVVMASVVDISDRIRSEKRFRLAIEAAPNAMIMVDETGTILLVNRQTESLFGYSRGEMVGQSVDILVPDAVRAAHPGMFASFFSQPKARAMGAGRDLLGRRKNGSEVPLEIGLNPIETDTGVVVVASVVDISERKEAEEELKRSNQELEQFAYVASHDLQEPLRMVGSFAGLLVEKYEGQLDEEGERWLAFLSDGATRMRLLVQDLLAYSRVGNQELDVGPIDTNEVVQGVVEDLEAQLHECNAEVSIEDLPMCVGKEAQVRLLFQNLISNALKFRKPDVVPRISVRGSKTGVMTRYEVEDNGLGIDEAFVQRIFVIFQRLHTQKEYKGTGLGLAICRKIVHRHGGELWVESELGRGSTFCFTLQGQ